MSSSRSVDPDRFRRVFLLLLTAGISVLFFVMIRQFLVALLVAAILSGMFHPAYRRLVRLVRGRRSVAAGITVLLVFLVIIVPLLGFLGIVTSQAVELSQAVRPWVEQQIDQPGRIADALERVPLANRVVEALAPYREQILSRAGELASRLGGLVVSMLTAAARQTALFLFLLFVMLYAMFFFLMDGKRLLDRILYYLPLPPEDESRMVDKFVSVSRATIKGTLVIGLLQGGLAGAAFWVAGIGGAAFWGTVMAVLSIIPGVGSALIWVPAVIYLGLVGKWVTALGLFLWCAVLVGSVDNFLRPWLVGRDTKMPDLLILLATLGGIVLFGALGVVIGPIVAALFVTVWDLYGTAFRDVLPADGTGTSAERRAT